MNKFINGVSKIASTRVLILILLAVGAYGLWVSCKMAYKFGVTISPEHATGLVLVTILAAFIFAARDIFKARGDKTMVYAATILGVMFIAAEFWSHIGYTVGQRHGNVVNATVQQTVHSNVSKSVDEDEATLKALEANLKTLETKNAWAASADAKAWRLMLEEKQAAADREAARVRCGPKCELLKAEVIELAKKIGTLEQRASLTERIDSTRKSIAERRARFEKTDVGESSVIEQALLPAKLLSGSLNPDKTSIGWAQIFIGLFMAVIQTALAPGAITTAFRLANVSHTDDIPTGHGTPRNEGTGGFSPSQTWEPKPSVPSVPSTQLVPKDNVTIVNVDKDNSLCDELLGVVARLQNIRTAPCRT